MKIIIKNKLILKNTPGTISEIIKNRLTFDNPQYQEKERMRRWIGDTPKELFFYEQAEHDLMTPRGFISHLLKLLRDHNITFEIIDNRHSLEPIDFKFNGKLKQFQKQAVSAILKKDFGTLTAPTGSGKTVMALNIIAQRKQPALIVVHTKELLYQWIERINQFLNIPEKQIGIIGNGKKTIGDQITVSLVQSLYKCAPDVSKDIGHLIVDECHRCPSRTFSEAVKAFDSKYMLGLSATPYRRDKLSRLIYFFIGNVQHKIEQAELVNTGDILKPDLVKRETSFQTMRDPVNEYSAMLSDLTQDKERNLLIACDVAKQASKQGVSLILSDRKQHCKELSEILYDKFEIQAPLLTGDVPIPQRQQIIENLNNYKIKVLIATGQLIGEGFDCKALSSLFMATPIKFKGRLLQYLGRILRPGPGKHKATVFDYIDVNVGVLVASANSRQRVYDEHKKG